MKQTKKKHKKHKKQKQKQKQNKNKTKKSKAYNCTNDNLSNAAWGNPLATGQTFSGTCNPGFSGSPTRMCSLVGTTAVWGSLTGSCSGEENNFTLFLIRNYFLSLEFSQPFLAL